MKAQHKIWCDKDEHQLYEYYTDFNEWLESEDGQLLREEYGIDSLSKPSKAFYAGDKAAYDQAFREYRKDRRHEALNETYLRELLGDDPWFERNLNRFEQLVNCMTEGNVVPFIGAGISVAGRFPTWKDHLRQQGRTANIALDHIEELLANGKYETVIEEIEKIRGREVFTQEIRDIFSRTGTIPDAIWRVTELFTDTVITTNYDRLIEQAFDTGEKNAFQIINGMNAMEKPAGDKVTIIKLHGDIQNPAKCILSKNQYNDAYGHDALDLERPIPKLLSYYFRNSSLLFLGCSLNNDRTIQVFRAVKEQIGDEEMHQHFSIEQAPEDENELADRNAFLAKLSITAIWFEKGLF
jgi:NAD-dependent SIR2 family protein deacetylase